MTKSLSELNQEAQALLVKYGVNKIYATSDGQFFLLESRAHLHAGKNHTVYPIEANEKEVVTNSAEGDTKEALSVKALTELIAGENDLEKVHLMLLEEIAGQNRKSAIAAFEKRIAILTDLRTKEDIKHE
jgi:hypothetical protein